MSKKPICRICHLNVATVPDRDIPGRPIKRLCSECHAERLRGDLRRILPPSAGMGGPGASPAIGSVP
jgi:hypothetical protein